MSVNLSTLSRLWPIPGSALHKRARLSWLGDKAWQGFPSDTMAKLGKFLTINLDLKFVCNLYADSTLLDFIFISTSSKLQTSSPHGLSLPGKEGWCFIGSLPRKCLAINRSNMLSFKNFLMCIHQLKKAKMSRGPSTGNWCWNYSGAKAKYTQYLHMNFKRAFLSTETSRWQRGKLSKLDGRSLCQCKDKNGKGLGGMWYTCDRT